MKSGYQPLTQDEQDEWRRELDALAESIDNLAIDWWHEGMEYGRDERDMILGYARKLYALSKQGTYAVRVEATNG